MNFQNVNALETQDVFAALGFTARSVTIENFSNSWIWIEAAAKFIAPWRAQTLQLLSAVDQAQITWRNPPLVPVSPSTNGQAFTYWSSEPTQTTPAITLYTGQGQTSVVNSDSKSAGGPFTHTGIAIPQGTVVLALTFNSPAVSATNMTITVTGEQSGNKYFNAAISGTANLNNFFTTPFYSKDTSVSISFTVVGPGTIGYDLIAYPFVPTPAQSTVNGLLTDATLRVGGILVSASNPVPVSAPNPIPVTIQDYINEQTAEFELITANTTIVAAVVGKTIKLIGYRFDCDPSSATMPSAGRWRLQGHTSLTIVGRGRYNAQTNSGIVSQTYTYRHDENGALALSISEALDFIVVNDSGGGSGQQYTGEVNFLQV